MHSQRTCMITTLIVSLVHVCKSQCSPGNSGPIVAKLQSNSGCASYMNGFFYYDSMYNGRYALKLNSNIFLYYDNFYGWWVGNSIGSKTTLLFGPKDTDIWTLNQKSGWIARCPPPVDWQQDNSIVFTISQQCSPCAAGTYSETSEAFTCTTCPENFTSVSGSSALASCKCSPGYTAASGVECTPCAPGTFKAVLGSHTCTACGRGTFAESPGASACTACGHGKYSDAEGALSETACRPLRVLNASDARAAVRVEAETCALACQPPYVLLRERLRAVGLWGRTDVAAGAVVLETPELPSPLWGLDAERTCVRCSEDACGVGRYPAGVLCQCMDCEMDEELDALPAIM